MNRWPRQWYMSLNTQLLSMYTNDDLFNGKAKYGYMLEHVISWKVLKMLVLKLVYTVVLMGT